MTMIPASAFESFLEWEFIDGVIGYYATSIDQLGFMLVFFGATFMALYETTGSVQLSVVVLVLLAPLVIGLIPAVGVNFAYLLLVLMVVAGGWLLIKSLS